MSMNMLTVSKGIRYALESMGITVSKFDQENNILYLEIPERSFEYEKNNITPEDIAKKVKESMQKLIDFNIRVKYKLKDMYWSEEMSKEIKEKLDMVV